MADLNAILSQDTDTPTQSSKLDSIISAADKPEEKPAAKPFPWYERAGSNFMDAFHGAGQFAQNIIPDKAMNLLREGAGNVAASIPGVPQDFAEALKEPHSTAEINQAERERAQDYAARKKAAGMKESQLLSPSTWDPAAIGGTLANPVNWMAPDGAAASALGRIALAARNGAMTALWQPETSGDFWSGKIDQAKLGAAAGGLFATATEALSPLLKWGTNLIRDKLGSGPQADLAASTLVDDIAKKANIDPKDLPPEFKSSIQEEITRAARAGTDPDPQAILRQTRAASVGMKLTEGQALQDPNLYAAEQKLRGVNKGNELSLLDRANQTAAINKLSELGAKGAPDTYEAAQSIMGALKQKDEQLQGVINNAYSKVRNSEGLSAKIDHIAFADDALARLGKQIGGTADLEKAAPEVLRVIDEISNGKQPLTVENAMALDKWLSRKSFSQAHGDISTSINMVRQALNDAPVQDALGEGAQEAYTLAKGLARDRFQLLDKTHPNFVPAFKAAVEGEAPDKFFEKYITRGNVRDVSKLLQLAPETQPTVSGSLMRQIQEHVVNGPVESGTFSESKLGNILDNPANIERAKLVFGPQKTQELINLRQAAADAFRPPRGTDVPSYKTGKSLAGLGEMAGNVADYVLPGKARAAIGVVKAMGERVKEAGAAEKATKGVPISRFVPKPPNRQIAQLAAPAAAIAINANEE